jgi:hypothetical protein
MNPASLPLSIQIGLGIGYLGYLVAYGGARKGHSTLDATFLSLVFGIPALVVASTPGGTLPLDILVGGVVSLALAAFWRIKGRSLWFAATRFTGLSKDDGHHSVWEGLLNREDGIFCSQLSVHTADGRVLYLNDRRKFKSAPYEGLNLGADGSILMVVEKEKMPNGAVEQRHDLEDPDFGTRLTFIPADQVQRVNIRF